MHGRKKIPVRKNRIPSMHQERTKTQNCTKITNTTINEDKCEYGGYDYMMITITGLLWARKKMQHEKRTEVRLAKRLGLIQRLRFSNLGLNYRDTTTARASEKKGDAATNDSTLVLKIKFLKFGILCQMSLRQWKHLVLLSLLFLDHLMRVSGCFKLWIISLWHQKQTMAWVLHVFLSNLQNTVWVKVRLIVSKNHINCSKACHMETLTFQ